MLVVWDFHGKEGNSHGDGKVGVWYTDVCWPIFNNGTQRGLGLSPGLSHLVHVQLQLPVGIAPLLGQVLHLHSFRQLGGNSKVLPESFLS